MSVAIKYYSDNESKSKAFESSNCMILSRNINEVYCKRVGNCYQASWHVLYSIGINFGNENRAMISTNVSTIIEGTTYIDKVSATNEENKYTIGSTYDCFYNKNSVRVCQWNKPSSGKGFLAMLLIGIGAIAFSLIIIGISCVIFRGKDGYDQLN
eukprot:TRINITY_DN12956_c0_g1_i1.p1 TRINITY_DN12956_c0_g1~~TRINITY_DN12956_c0_g1_i1.p1  ORF type:complete len:180 (+),score=14.64 TRINITY_DN12956_c0_g1_i1:77-541(+)